MFLFLSLILNSAASPPGPGIGGVTLGSPLPSGFKQQIDSYGQPAKNLWYKMSAIGGLNGKLSVEVCRGVVYDIVFSTLPETSLNAHHLWSEALKGAGFPSPLPYNHCTTREDYLCQTWWTNKDRRILMMWLDDGTPALAEGLDGVCTEGI